MTFMLALSVAIDSLLERIARLFGWLFFALVGVIVWDVITRKLGFQIPGFGSTPIQELEWHLHGAIFLPWLGYAYVRNVHVRIDVFTAALAPRKAAWLELIGIFVFALPYTLVAIYFSYKFAQTSFLQNESSAAPNGLPYRWVIKSFLFAGLALLMASVVSVFCRNVVFLFGPRALAERAAMARAAAH
jgi:TRAP-type mannitol/chloroaromatic compound transport system permease small subunit